MLSIEMVILLDSAYSRPPFRLALTSLKFEFLIVTSSVSFVLIKKAPPFYFIEVTFVNVAPSIRRLVNLLMILANPPPFRSEPAIKDVSTWEDLEPKMLVSDIERESLQLSHSK